jgi:hypothetical protein
MIIREVGYLAPLAGSADTANSSPARRPDTITGAVIPARGAGSMPAARGPELPISHSS